MIQFTDSSTNTPTSWTWSFGDGVSSSVQDPVHTYTAAGTYTITLIATNTEGSNVATQTNLITVTSAQTVTQITTQATPVPTPLAPTFAITAAETTDSSTADWLAKQNAVVATTTKKSPGYDMFSALIGCGVIAGIAVYRKR
jgi:PKD repeat protein